MSAFANVKQVREQPALPPPQFKTVGSFAAEFEAVAYIIESIVRTRTVYCLTAKTGVGKTGWLVAAALAVATGRHDILGVEVARARVVYLCYENPDDLRMRLLVAAFHLNIDLGELGEWLLILDARRSPEDIAKQLAALAQDGDFGLIIVDTFAAAFDGKDINDNVATGEFLRRHRPMTNLPGYPAVIVATHPVKNASDDNLVPYGGGAILNECDGNLTLSRKGDIVTLSWQGKFRGIFTEPRIFKFELASSPDVVDAKGRQIELRLLRPSSEEVVAQREESTADAQRRLLQALHDNPKASLRVLGEIVGIPKSTVSVRLNRLAKEKLADQVLERWVITAKGINALQA
jgi:hypothetical protein